MTSRIKLLKCLINGGEKEETLTTQSWNSSSYNKHKHNAVLTIFFSKITLNKKECIFIIGLKELTNKDEFLRCFSILKAKFAHSFFFYIFGTIKQAVLNTYDGCLFSKTPYLPVFTQNFHEKIMALLKANHKIYL